MFKYTLSKTSLENLKGVHPDLIRVVKLAIANSSIDFRIIEGLRSKNRQRQMFINGRSQTLNSKHVTGHAIDIAPLVNNKIPWENNSYFFEVAEAMKKSAASLKTPLIWGGDWPKFKDYSHFELKIF